MHLHTSMNEHRNHASEGSHTHVLFFHTHACALLPYTLMCSSFIHFHTQACALLSYTLICSSSIHTHVLFFHTHLYALLSYTRTCFSSIQSRLYMYNVQKRVLPSHKFIKILLSLYTSHEFVGTCALTLTHARTASYACAHRLLHMHILILTHARA